MTLGVKNVTVIGEIVTPNKLGVGARDCGARGPVPDPEPCLWGLSRGPVVCVTTNDKSRGTGTRVRTCTYI